MDSIEPKSEPSTIDTETATFIVIAVFWMIACLVGSTILYFLPSLIH